jgi:glycosyltransferase involved in cell wall biosynthesis
VIIPAYNSEKYLDRCIASLINQTLENIEIIFVDDNSTDSSPQILQKYAQNDPRIKIITNKTNQKPGGARNRGMEIAAGEFIGFVDSDDWIDLDFYEKLYNAAKKYNADIANANMALHGYSKKSAEKYNFKKTEEFLSAQDKINTLLNGGCFSVCQRIYLRDKIIEHNITFPESTYGEDQSFCLKALYYLGKMVSVPEVFYHRQYRANSASNENPAENQRYDCMAKYVMARFADEQKIDYFPDLVLRKDIWGLPGVPLFKIKHYLKHKSYYLFGLKVFSIALEFTAPA